MLKMMMMVMFVVGMKVLIDGNVPLSAGLSSSSALVVCSALTTAIINGIQINKVDLVGNVLAIS